jgi:hypothetical protein
MPLTRLIPIYSSRGQPMAFLAYPYLYDLHGSWIGLVQSDRRVFSVHGHYVGEMTAEPRILRKREESFAISRIRPPAPPPPIHPPQTVPLAPMMPEVPQNMVDVLDEMPELLPSKDHGELRDDLD